MDPIALLARDDRWHLSAGEGLLFAPPHPLWLDAPGFWDGASLLGAHLWPLFTVTALDDDGGELPLHLTSRRWSPAEIAAEYRLGNGATATEVRTVQPGGVLASEWRVEAPRPTRVHLIAWTAQPKDALEGDMRYDGTIVFRRRSSRGAAVHEMALACVGGTTSWALGRSEPAPLHPHWRYTPFAGQWTSDGLPAGHPHVSPADVTYGAVHRALFVAAEGASAVFAMRVVAADVPTASSATPHAQASAHSATLGGASRRRWRDYFSGVPAFRCSDPYVEHCYWYRWSCLELLAAGGRGVCEGTGHLHRLTSDAASGHARELRWTHDGLVAREALRAVWKTVRADGSIPKLLDEPHVSTPPANALGDWGSAVLALESTHPDESFASEAYVALARHARWILRERTVGTGLVKVMRGEVAFDDPERWAGVSGLCGVDAAVSTYELLLALQWLAARVGAPEDVPQWDSAATRLANAVRDRMWDPEWKLFRDVHPTTEKRTGPRSVVCFYPYRTDLADAGHLAGLEESLLSPDAFWTTFPVATAPANDARFSRFADGGGVRGAAPFGGPVVPLVNSCIIDSLARVARAYAPHLRAHVAHLLRRTIHMFFESADPGRIGSYEYYDPLEGRASVHRSTSDSTRSWVIDAIVQYVAGIRPHDRGLTIDPMPFGMELVDLTGACVRGRSVDVRIEGDRVTVTVAGVQREGRIGTPMDIAM